MSELSLLELSIAFGTLFSFIDLGMSTKFRLYPPDKSGAVATPGASMYATIVINHNFLLRVFCIFMLVATTALLIHASTINFLSGVGWILACLVFLIYLSAVLWRDSCKGAYILPNTNSSEKSKRGT